MTPQIAMVFGTFLFMIVFMIWGKIEPCIVVMLSLGFLWFTGILDTATAFGQFSGNTIIVMIFMMMCSAGLMKTNILIHITHLVKRLNGGERVLYIVAMLTPFVLCQILGGVSSLMTTIPSAGRLGGYQQHPPHPSDPACPGGLSVRHRSVSHWHEHLPVFAKE